MKKINTARKGHPDPKFSLQDVRPLLKDIDTKPVAVRRSVMRSLSLTDIPKSLRGLAFDKASELFADRSETVAVKVFAMSVMTQIALQEAGLKNEVIIGIEEQLPYGSAAYRSRAAKLLKALKR